MKVLEIKNQFDTLQKSDFQDYSPGLNSIKALLILLVILSHALPLSLFLFFLFFFHMPLFLSISSFLLKKSTFDLGLYPFFKKLFKRLIIPWLIAFIVYIPFQFQQRSIATFSIYDIIYPYFHLWYVPAYILGTILCFETIKFKISTKIILLITFTITIIWFLIYRDPQIPNHQLPGNFIGEKRFYSYLLFFFLGFGLRNHLLKYKPNALLLLFLMGISIITVFGIIFIGEVYYYLFIFPYLVFNISLIFFVLIYTSTQSWTENRFILFLNKQSLGIYLYHPLFTLIAYEYINDPQKLQTNNFTGLVIFSITVALTSLLVWILSQFDLTNKYVLGNVKKLSA